MRAAWSPPLGFRGAPASGRALLGRPPPPAPGSPSPRRSRAGPPGTQDLSDCSPCALALAASSRSPRAPSSSPVLGAPASWRRNARASATRGRRGAGGGARGTPGRRVGGGALSSRAQSPVPAERRDYVSQEPLRGLAEDSGPRVTAAALGGGVARARARRGRCLSGRAGARRVREALGRVSAHARARARVSAPGRVRERTGSRRGGPGGRGRMEGGRRGVSGGPWETRAASRGPLRPPATGARPHRVAAAAAIVTGLLPPAVWGGGGTAPARRGLTGGCSDPLPTVAAGQPPRSRQTVILSLCHFSS